MIYYITITFLLLALICYDIFLYKKDIDNSVGLPVNLYQNDRCEYVLTRVKKVKKIQGHSVSYNQDNIKSCMFIIDDRDTEYCYVSEFEITNKMFEK